MKVYFLSSAGRIKVGSSRDVEARRRQISQHLPVAAELIGMIDGSIDIERAAQRFLRAHHIKNEWFKDCPTARREIQRIMAEPSVLDSFKPVREEQKPIVLTPVDPARARAARLLAVETMWGPNYSVELAKLADTDEATARAWLNDEIDMPDLVRTALKGLLLEFFMTGGHR